MKTFFRKTFSTCQLLTLFQQPMPESRQLPASLSCPSRYPRVPVHPHHQSTVHSRGEQSMRLFPIDTKDTCCMGISHLLDEVPYKNLQPLKSRLIAHFGRGKILPLLPGRILPFPRRPELYPQNFPPIQHSGRTGFRLLQRGIQMVER